MGVNPMRAEKGLVDTLANYVDVERAVVRPAMNQGRSRIQLYS